MPNEEQARDNAKAIESEIRALEIPERARSSRNFRDFWTHVRRISDMFKTLKPLLKEDRERLWGQFGSLCEAAKQEQQKEQKENTSGSAELRDQILREAETARPCTLFGFDPPDVQEMKRLSTSLRNAGGMLSRHKNEMLGEHKQECFARIQEIRQIHDIWWGELKTSRSRRHEDVQQRIRANLEGNYERHRRASETLSRLRCHTDDLREKIMSAWNDSFRGRATEWLSNTEDKIRDIEEFLKKVEEWIREDEQKLR